MVANGMRVAKDLILTRQELDARVTRIKQLGKKLKVR
jgi:hypothetical protein